MATIMRHAQEAKNMCHVHSDEEIDMYCFTCKKSFCSKCIKESHRLHDWEILSKVIKEKYLQIPDKCKEVRDIHIPVLQGFVKNLKAAKNRESQKKFELIQRVNKHKNRIMMTIERIAEETVYLIDNKSQDVNKGLDAKISTLENNIKDLEALVETLNQNSTSGSGHGIIDLEESLETKISQIKKPETDNLKGSSHFVEGTHNFKILKTIFGHIQDRKEQIRETRALITLSDKPMVSIEKHSSFTHGDKFIRAIYTTSETTAWVHKAKTTGNELLTEQGKEIDQIDSGEIISHFTILDKNDTVYTNYDGCTINRMTATGLRTTLINMAPLHPWGISLSQNGDLLVALMDRNDYSTDCNRQRLVQQVTLSGEIKKTYQFDQDSDVPLFTLPYRVCQNYNLDICVIDCNTVTCGQLCILSEEGELMHTYIGNESQCGFTDLDCDYNCNILVCDASNHKIHLLDPCGQLVKLLITDKDGLHYPNSLSLYHDKLWIGCAQGKIKVFKYKY